jgi:hypothetical protein
MKRFFSPCRNIRRDLCLLAGGVLPEPEREKVLIHLAACSDCRKYLAEIKSVTTSLSDWEKDFAHIQPGQAVQTRWARAVQAAGRMEPVCQLPINPENIQHPTSNAQHPVQAPTEDHWMFHIREWCLDVIWPYRRVWAGLAVVWVLIFLGNLSLQDHASALARKSSPPTQEMIMAFRDQQVVLAELLADHSAPCETERPKIFSPRPRTENVAGGRFQLANAARPSPTQQLPKGQFADNLQEPSVVSALLRPGTAALRNLETRPNLTA